MSAAEQMISRVHPWLDGKLKKLFINGEWVEGSTGRTFESRNPATGELLAEVAEGDAEDINRAVRAARAAFNGPWSKFKPYDRQEVLLRLCDLMDKHYDELSLLETLDMGGPISRTRSRKTSIIGMLRYYAGMATALHGEVVENSQPGHIFTYTSKEPIGVVGAITAWNGPINAVIWKLGPILATGCTAVFKPAEEAPLCALRIAELSLEAGIPPGVFNVVSGFGETAGAALSAHEDVDKIAFTGSHITGQHLIRASAGNIKRLSLELGGKSANIVFADADLDLAVPGSAMAAFSNTGQVCGAGTRLFVERKVHDQFVEKVAAYGKSLKVGNGQDPKTQIGPLVSQQQLERVTGYFAIGQNEGASVASGAERVSEGDLSKGYFVSPTVFANVKDEMRIAREEIFGPVVSVLPFDDIDEVIARGNASQYGLGGGVWTQNLKKAHRIAKGLRSGSVWVNCWMTRDPAMPFGGYKMSGYGRESGIQHLEEFLNVKSVWMNVT